ncbi:ABC transporter substrate-binding protein [Uliginosibacterium sp. sgz301328]|uniref:ABC transporter substrate-binding protein n=1 Tax=Uliginosibacterium sp. sgz301328 TaxID=3243764 RepID=UPI00359E345C
MNKTLRAAAMAVCLSLGAGLVQAADLRVALSTEQTTMDPDFARNSPNQAMAAQFFDRLVAFDADMRQVPALAESWREVDPTTWEIKLRHGVKFSNGANFDAQDVIATVNRIPKIKGSPASFDSSVANIESITAPDPYTLRVKLKTRDPRFINDIGELYITSREVKPDTDSDAFNTGKAMIGTGPYKFVEWRRGEYVKMEANPYYWGKQKPHFKQVTLRFIGNGASRIAALLSGDADLVEGVPTSDLAGIESNKSFKVWRKSSARLIYLSVDSTRDKSPFVTDNNGNPIANPFKDVRVRRAVAMLVNKKALVDRVMRGVAEPTGQFVPEGLIGYAKGYAGVPYDPVEAKKLLTAAGYPNGFRVTLQAPNDRFQNDSQVAQAVGQLLARGGLQAQVEVMPNSVFLKRASAQEFSMFLFGFGSTSGSALRGLNQTLHTYDKESGQGLFNRSRYSNPTFDKQIEAADKEADPAKHQAGLEQATRTAMDDVGMIPLYFEQLTWVAKKNINFKPRRDERTMVVDITE